MLLLTVSETKTEGVLHGQLDDLLVYRVGMLLYLILSSVVMKLRASPFVSQKERCVQVGGTVKNGGTLEVLSEFGDELFHREGRDVMPIIS